MARRLHTPGLRFRYDCMRSKPAISPSCRIARSLMMRPPPLAQTSKPYPQTDIRKRRRTIHSGHNGPTDALTILPQSNSHHTAHTV